MGHPELHQWRSRFKVLLFLFCLSLCCTLDVSGGILRIWRIGTFSKKINCVDLNTFLCHWLRTGYVPCPKLREILLQHLQKFVILLNKKTLHMPYYVFTSVDDCKLISYTLALLQCAPLQIHSPIQIRKDYGI